MGKRYRTINLGWGAGERRYVRHALESTETGMLRHQFKVSDEEWAAKVSPTPASVRRLLRVLVKNGWSICAEGMLKPEVAKGRVCGNNAPRYVHVDYNDYDGREQLVPPRCYSRTPPPCVHEGVHVDQPRAVTEFENVTQASVGRILELLDEDDVTVWAAVEPSVTRVQFLGYVPTGEEEDA